MPACLHKIKIQAAPRAVFDAWTTEKGISAWWTKECRMSQNESGVHIFVFDNGNVKFHFRIDEQIPAKTIRWTGIAADKMPQEWVGTRIEVDINASEGSTILKFGHINWQSTQGLFALCNTTWGELMYRLRDHCEGKGRGPLFFG